MRAYMTWKRLAWQGAIGASRLIKRVVDIIVSTLMLLAPSPLMLTVAWLIRRDGVTFKMKDDPRVTPVGKFIRKTSIDELPQLINILRGEMSLVGPRTCPGGHAHLRESIARGSLLLNWRNGSLTRLTDAFAFPDGGTADRQDSPSRIPDKPSALVLIFQSA